MQMAPSEILALSRILEELDYYQILNLERGAEASAVKRAYHDTSRTFHPDANRSLEGEMREASRRIAMRVSEAYAVLRDPRRRGAYDEHLDSGAGARLQLTQAQAQAGRKNAEERGGKTPQGRQFFKLAETALEKDDLVSAANNLQTALTFEPANEGFKTLLADVRKRLR